MRSPSSRTLPDSSGLAATSRPARSPAASSKCSRSRAHSPPGPALLLDEPSMGLAPPRRRDLRNRREERARGTSILLVEQNARAALTLADRAYVMDRGNIVLEGTGGELIERKEVIGAYLGV